MMWMSENSHERNKRRLPVKNELYLNRMTHVWVGPVAYERLEKLLEECMIKYLDRDVEISIMLDSLELLKSGLEHEKVAKIIAEIISYEVQCGRISPLQACIARDLVNNYNNSEFHLISHVTDGDILGNNDNPYVRERRYLYELRARRLMSQEKLDNFITYELSDHEDFREKGIEFSLMFDAMEMFNVADIEVAVDVITRMIDQEVEYGRILPDQRDNIIALVDEYSCYKLSDYMPYSKGREARKHIFVVDPKKEQLGNNE